MLCELLNDLITPSSLVFQALLAGLLASIACGIVGSYVVVKRCSYMVGAISHSLLGGIGLACYCRYKWPDSFFTPFAGAFAAAALAACIITWLTRHKDARTDTALSAIWTLGAAAGVSFIHAIPGYPVDLNSYLFGSILLVSPQELIMMAAVDTVLLIIVYLFHSRFLFYCFNEEGLGLRGVSLWRTGLLLNLIIAVTVVLLAQIVGLILCLALLILPVATASLFSRSLKHIMCYSAFLSFLFVALGICISYCNNMPTGTLIVEIAGIVYLSSALLNRVFRSKSA